LNGKLTEQGLKNIITPYRLVLIGLIGVSIMMGLAILKVNPLVPIGGVIAVVIAFLLLKYDYFGLILYFIVFMTRPGEMYPALAPFRIEFLLGGSISFLTLIKNKYRFGTLSIPRSRLNLDFALFLGAIAISFFLSSCKTCTVDRFEHMIKLGIFYLLIILIVDSKKRLEIFFWTFIVLITRIAIDVTAGFYGGEAVYKSGVMRATSQNSIADNFNGIAITLNTAFPFVYYLFLHYRSPWKKAVLGMILSLFVVTLLLTGSRGGLLGFFALLGCIWWMSRYKVFLAAAIVVFSVVGWFSISEGRQRRYASIFDSSMDASSQGRVDAWRDGMLLLLERPLTGVGASGFLQARVDKFGVYLNPHSLYIQVFAELGIIGGFIFFFMFLRDIIRINLRVIRDVKTRGSPHALLVPFARATIIACLSLLVTGVFAHSTYRYTWYLQSNSFEETKPV
jgi:O-antigen ligase